MTAAGSPQPWRIGVVIPAHDEALHIARALDSVLDAVDLLPSSVRAQVVVVADACTDGTASIARSTLQERGKVVVSLARSVGVSRALGMQRILTRWQHPFERTWLANTDADSVVPPTWLTDQLALADAGATAVAGVIEVDSFSDLVPGAGPVFRQRYAFRDGVEHPHVHGANLGVRADAYLDVGGWASLVTAEDHDLWNRLRARGWPVRADPAVVVTTSGRRVGRAPLGFAVGLDQLNESLSAACPESAA